MVSQKRENNVGGREGCGAESESSRGKASFLNLSGYSLQIAAPRLSCLPKDVAPVGWKAEAAVSVVFRDRAGGLGENASASHPQSSHNLLHVF